VDKKKGKKRMKPVEIERHVYKNVPESPQLCWGDEWHSLSPGGCVVRAGKGGEG
jgi:hypothetical protein